METKQPLTTTEYAVLGLVALGESSGYDLARAAAQSIDYMWAPSRSQIYKVLPRLVERGYARSRQIAQTGRPDKELYRITRAGRTRLVAWLEQVEDDPDEGFGIFVLKLYFGSVAPPAAALAQLDAYGRYTERRLAEFEQLENELEPGEPPHHGVVLRLGIARAHATLAWTEETRSALKALDRARQPV